MHDELAQASPDLTRDLLTTFFNTLLSAQADSVCGAEYRARDPEQVNRHNGYRHRELDTRVGTLDVAVPNGLRLAAIARADGSQRAWAGPD